MVILCRERGPIDCYEQLPVRIENCILVTTWSDISSEDTLGLTIFENHILKFQDILFLEKIARV